MNAQKLLRHVTGLVSLLLFLVGCSTPAATLTPVSTASLPATAALLPPATATPTATPTAAPRVAGLSDAEVATLSSLEQVDDYPLYTMRHYGAYGQAASHQLNGPTSLPGWACSLFATLGDARHVLYGRNFDWEYSPALLLFTDPPDGYASVSMVDVAYLGFGGASAEGLTDLPLDARRALLNAPFLPFDGMNERGLAVGMAAVPGSQTPYDPGRETLGSLGIIREMLDHARDVDQAVALMRSYNISMLGGPPLHYLIADASGRAALVEFYEGEMLVIPNGTPWHLATNFLRAAAGASAEGRCWRYDRIARRLKEADGRLTPQEAMDLLAEASQPITQWSVVYDVDGGAIHVALGREYEDVHTFHLGLADP
jgi:hypothetical protein